MRSCVLTPAVECADRVKKYVYIVLSGILSCCSLTPAFCQGSWKVRAGFGVPELLNVGLNFRLDQLELGFCIGSLPVTGDKIVSVLGDIRYHFAGHSTLSDSRPWFVGAGLNYLRDEIESKIDNFFYLNLRIGREFNMTERVGIAADVGTLFQLMKTESRKKPPYGWNLNINFPVFLSFGIGLFYRF